MSKREQFEALKEGDKVWVESSRYGWSVETFKRTTKTLLVTTFKGVEYRYDIETGRKKGSDRWNFVTAEVFTEEHQEIIDKYKLSRFVKTSLESLLENYKSLDKEDLDVILKLVDKHK
tara:strand:- start:526 stop:879 length:354 start_codon:yes stop_codon:yes gene_type:complete